MSEYLYSLSGSLMKTLISSAETERFPWLSRISGVSDVVPFGDAAWISVCGSAALVPRLAGAAVRVAPPVSLPEPPRSRGRAVPHT